MKIYYQGFAGAYGYEASKLIAKKFKIEKENIYGLLSFTEVCKKVEGGEIGVLPIENSYAGSVHENFFNIIGGDFVVINEIHLEINHCLLANTKNLSDIKEVFSHPQALMQCRDFCINNNLTQSSFLDTAGAAKYVKESGRTDVASISSMDCKEIYNLNLLEKAVQDQEGNTTRFLVVISRKIFKDNEKKFKTKKTNKMTIVFKTKDRPSALYKCLGAFATRFINLSKIESIAANNKKFEYLFWIDLDIPDDKKAVDGALEEVKFFCKDLTVLGEY